MNRQEYLEANSKAFNEHQHDREAQRAATFAVHRAYYAQFVNEQTIAHILRYIGTLELLHSTDLHLNDIDIKRWDRLANQWMPIAAKFKDFNDFPSQAGFVCVAKEAARQWLDQERSEPIKAS